jgi:acyl-CoA synthetase (NDP forming)
VEWASLLSDYGLPVVPGETAASADAAVAAAERLGYPVVLKSDAAEVHHKTEADGVRLGLGDAAAVASAYTDVTGRLGPRVVVQHQASGVEVALGIVRDPLLGPLVMVAAGGVLVELVGDRAVALPPLDRETATELIGRLKVATLLAGFRGSAPADTEALADAVVSLGQLAVELGDHLDGLDLNPVLVGTHAAYVVDALVIPRAR